MKNAFYVLLIVCLCIVGYQVFDLTTNSTQLRQQTAQVENFKTRLTSLNEWISYALKGSSNSKYEIQANQYVLEADKYEMLSNLYTVLFVILSIICLVVATHYKSKFLLAVTLLVIWIYAFNTPLLQISVVSQDLEVQLSSLLPKQTFEGNTYFLYTSKSLFDALSTLLKNGHFLLFILLILPSVILPLCKIASLSFDTLLPLYLSKYLLLDVFTVGILIAFITIVSMPSVRAELLSGFYLWLSFSFFLLFFSLRINN